MQDDGYHDVASAYQAVSLYEDVWAEPADDFSISISGTVDVSEVPADDRNLALRAARLVAQRAGLRGRRAPRHRQARPRRRRDGRRISGCRSRAGRVRCCCGAPTSADSELQRLAARLGADVPFALHGRHGDRHRPRRPAEPRAREGPLRLDHRDQRRRRAVDAGGLPAPRRAASRARTGHRAAAAGVPAVDAARAPGAPRGRRRRARRARPQRPPGGGAVAAAAICGRRSRSASRPARWQDWSRARARRSPSSRRDPSPRSSCRYARVRRGLNALHVHGPVPGARAL